MKKNIIGIGVAFIDIVVKTNYEEKNHSNFSNIHYEVGGSILNIVTNIKNGGFIYKSGNDYLSNYVIQHLKNHAVIPYNIPQQYPMPIFTIINQKERYTSLTAKFEINDETVFDYNICNDYHYGITNSKDAKFINDLINNTTCKWIINSFIPENVEYFKLEGCILNREEASKYNTDFNIVLEHLKNNKIKWAIITLDKEGCVYLEDNRIKRLKPNTINLNSKIRTGDLFTSTIIKQLLEKQTLTNAIKKAMDVVETFLLETK